MLTVHAFTWQNKILIGVLCEKFHKTSMNEAAAYSWSAVLYEMYSRVFPLSVHILGILMLYRLIYMVLSVRSVWCHSNHVNAHASEAKIIVRFTSTHSSVPNNYKTFQFTLPAGNLFTQENESRAWSQLSAGGVIVKIRVLAKSWNPGNLRLFWFHSSALFLHFYRLTFPSMWRQLSSESFNKLQTPVVN